jgi:hypothetical protein
MEVKDDEEKHLVEFDKWYQCGLRWLCAAMGICFVAILALVAGLCSLDTDENGHWVTRPVWAFTMVIAGSTPLGLMVVIFIGALCWSIVRCIWRGCRRSRAPEKEELPLVV